MKKSKWIHAVVLACCLLLASCDDNITPTETQDVTEMLPTITPDLSLNESINAYINTQKVAQEKADILTTTYHSNSVQYALIDNGHIVMVKSIIC